MHTRELNYFLSATWYDLFAVVNVAYGL